MSFKKLFLTASAAALFAGSALADGGPTPEPPPPPPPPPEEDSAPPPPPPPAAEPAPSMWYAALHGGAVWLDDPEFLSFGDLFATDMDTGWAVGGAVGYRYDNGFRAEFEGTWRDNDGEIFEVPFFLADPAEISALNFMLNALYDFNMNMGGFTPYIGAGLGAARVDMDFAGGTDDDGWAFAYQFIGGFSFPVSNTALEFFADYRYMRTAGLELFEGDVQDHDEYISHTVLGGLRFNF